MTSEQKPPVRIYGKKQILVCASAFRDGAHRNNPVPWIQWIPWLSRSRSSRKTAQYPHWSSRKTAKRAIRDPGENSTISDTNQRGLWIPARALRQQPGRLAGMTKEGAHRNDEAEPLTPHPSLLSVFSVCFSGHFPLRPLTRLIRQARAPAHRAPGPRWAADRAPDRPAGGRWPGPGPRRCGSARH